MFSFHLLFSQNQNSYSSFGYQESAWSVMGAQSCDVEVKDYESSDDVDYVVKTGMLGL